MTTTDKLLPCPFCGSAVRLGCDDYSIKASQKYYIECQGIDCLMQDMEDLDWDLLVAAWNRRASQAAPAHEDDLAVDRFAAVMKSKLAKKRNDGRGGWSGPECSEETLSRMLRDHIAKGDPVDVANFAMMLHQRGERIAQAAPAPDDQFVTTLPQEAFDAFAKACDEAPALSDGLREAANRALNMAREKIAERRNACPPGPLFKALNEAMGDIEDVLVALRRPDRPEGEA